MDNREPTWITKNALISGGGDSIGVVIRFVNTILTTQFIGAELYGIYILARTVTSIIGNITSIGLDQGLLKFVSFHLAREDTQKVKGNILSAYLFALPVSLAACFLAYGFAGPVADKIFHDLQLVDPIRILSFLIPINTITMLNIGAIWGFNRIAERTLIERILIPLLRFCALLPLLLLGLRLSAAVYATVFSSVSVLIISSIYILRIFPQLVSGLQPKFEHKKLLGFSAPLFGSKMLNLLMSRIDVLMIGYFLTSALVGIYSVATQVAGMVLMVLSAFNVAFAPRISHHYSRGEKQELRHLYQTITRWIITITLPVVVLIAYYGKPILGIFGKAFTLGASALFILILARMIDFSVGSAGFILKMTNRPQIVLMNSSLLVTFNVILNYLLIPRYGILGAALATGLSISVINILKLAEIYSLERIHPFTYNYGKTVAAVGLSSALLLLAGIFTKILQNNVFAAVVSIAAFAGCYMTLMLRWLPMEEDDRVLADSIMRKLRLKP